MEREKVIVYTASSVGLDYFFFLSRTIENAGYRVRPLYLISELEYRSLSRSNRFNKFVLRLKMYLLYPFYLILHGVLAKKGSVFVVTSNTFFAPFLVRFVFFRKSIKVVHMLYDLFPDALEVAGKLHTNSILNRLIGRVTRYTLANCDYTIYLGDFLKKHTEVRWGKARYSGVIDIATDLTLYSEKFLSLKNASKVIVHYGGQLGHLHDADTMISCIKFVLNSDIKENVKFNFYVSGSQASYLEESLEGLGVEVFSTIASAQWRNDIREFHVGLVSLSPGGANVCLPSKTYGMMSGGMAILAICPEWSDLADLVLKINGGKVVNNSIYLESKHTDYSIKSVCHREIDLIVHDFYTSLKDFVCNRDKLESMRFNAFSGVRNNYTIEHLSLQWKIVLEKVQNPLVSIT